MAPSECLTSIKTRCGGFQILWGGRKPVVSPPSRHQARAARPTKSTTPMFRVCRAARTAPISRAAPRAAAMVNPLKRLRIGGDRLYIRVPQFPLSSPTCVKFYYCNRRISGSVVRGCRTAGAADGAVSAVSARVSPSHAPDPRPAPRRGHWARFEVPDGLRDIADSSGFRWSIGAHSQPCRVFIANLLSRQVPEAHESTSPRPSARSGRRALCLARPPICRTASWSLWFAWWVSAGAQATCATGCL
jgi:hypothetical protein